MKYVTVIGKRIKYHRTKIGITQKALAHGICEESYISKVENGAIEPSSDILLQLKERLQISKVPITEKEYIEFLHELGEWHEDIKNRLLEETSERYENLKWRMENSLDERLEIPFYLPALRLSLLQGNLENTRKLLDEIAKHEQKFTTKETYYYYLGSYYLMNENSKGVQFCKKAISLDCDLNINESSLYYAIANYYSRHDQPISAIYYCLMALEKSKFKNEFAYNPYLEIILSYNYGIVGQHSHAEDILKKCLSKYKSMNDFLLLYNIYHTFGCVYLEVRQFALAINSFESAYQYCNENSTTYLHNMLMLSSAHEQNDNYTTAYALLEKGLAISLLNNYENEIIQFQSAIYAHDLSKASQLKYIENTTLPYYTRKGEYRIVVNYLEQLTRFYKNKHLYKQALKYSSFINYFLTIILNGNEVNYEEENKFTANYFNSNHFIK